LVLLNKEIAIRRSNALARGVNLVTNIYVARAENAEIWDVEGRRFIDFSAGIAVVNTGHRHPKVIAAVKEQLDQFTHTAHQVVPYENYVRLAERLNAIVPGNFDKKTLFATTGVEAVENAVKIARITTKRSALIAFSGAFHGRSFMGMSLTGKYHPYKAGFGAMMGDVHHVPFPSALQGITSEMALIFLEKLFKSDVAPEHVAAFIIEPIQGEGGFYPVPKTFMLALREIADKYGIVLIADEVQSGFARTGKLFAMEHFAVHADLTCLAKGLGGGFPIAAVTGKADMMDAAPPGGLGGTYAGNPVAVAAALAVLDIIEEEDLCARADMLGARLKQRLHSLQEIVPQIAEIRGLGLMMAVEFYDPVSQKPDVDFTKKVQAKALENGLILLTCGIDNNVIRFLSPLTIPDEIFNEALDILEYSLRETMSENG